MPTMIEDATKKVADRLGDDVVILGLYYSPTTGNGAVLYVRGNETISHAFDGEGYTYHGFYSGSGDNPVANFAIRVADMARRDLRTFDD